MGSVLAIDVSISGRTLSLDSDADKNGTESEDSRPTKKIKMALASMDMDTDADAATASEEMLTTIWRINHVKFMIDFRTDLIVDYVSQRIDPTAGAIVRAMMKSDQPLLSARPGTFPAFACCYLLMLVGFRIVGDAHI